MEKEELVDVIKEALKEHREIDEDRHYAHHQFIEMEIERRERNKALWLKFKLSIVGTAATALVGGLVWVGKVVIETLSRGHHP